MWSWSWLQNPVWDGIKALWKYLGGPAVLATSLAYLARWISAPVSDGFLIIMFLGGVALLVLQHQRKSSAPLWSPEMEDRYFFDSAGNAAMESLAGFAYSTLSLEQKRILRLLLQHQSGLSEGDTIQEATRLAISEKPQEALAALVQHEFVRKGPFDSRYSISPIYRKFITKSLAKEPVL